MFLLLALLLLIFVPTPWNVAAALASAVLGGIEVLYWERRMRGKRVRTGAEGMLGATGEVTTALRPSGQIRVHGELWEAHSPTPVDPGARVRVVAVEDLTLEVAPVEKGSAGTARAAGAALLVLIALLVLSGCGGDDESPSEAYANNVCSDVNDWVGEVQGAIGSIRESGLSTSRSDIETAVNNVASATQNLGVDLRDLGAPDTEAGNQAKSELQELGNVLARHIATVQTAVASSASVAAITATVSTALSQAVTAVQGTYQELQSLDATGELKDAFENSDECDSLREELDKAGSGS